MSEFEKFGISVPEILLPKNVDVPSWSVVACDQYTQDRGYWKRVEEICAGKNSTLRLIFPEAFLGDGDRRERIDSIKSTMEEYLAGGVFGEALRAFVCVERTTSYGRTRRGIVAAIDLEAYEWQPFSKSLVRATEATIVDRIPPRMEIRRGAKIETPHIMLLANDPEEHFIESLCEAIKARGQKPLYSGDLMQDGGSVVGWAADEDEDEDFIQSALERLCDAAPNPSEPFLFAVGDGNHSLATAKAVWEEHKKEIEQSGEGQEALATSRLRYALVEIVNLFDEGLTFEPIHRVVFGAEIEELILDMQIQLGGKMREAGSAEELASAVASSKAAFGFVYKSGEEQKCVLFETEITDLAVSRLQPALDNFLASKSGVEIDYIHGADEVARLGRSDGALGILLPPVDKDSLFDTIAERGPLPRKSFSMGEASEKRFYLECRALEDLSRRA